MAYVVIRSLRASAEGRATLVRSQESVHQGVANEVGVAFEGPAASMHEELDRLRGRDHPHQVRRLLHPDPWTKVPRGLKETGVLGHARESVRVQLLEQVPKVRLHDRRVAHQQMNGGDPRPDLDGEARPAVQHLVRVRCRPKPLRPLVSRDRSGPAPGHRVERLDESRLAAEGLVDGLLGDTGARGDRRHRGPREAVLEEQLTRAVEDGLLPRTCLRSAPGGVVPALRRDWTALDRTWQPAHTPNRYKAL